MTVTPADQLSTFLRREALDHIMLGFVLGLQSGLPSVSQERALEMFTSRFGLNAPNSEAQRRRYRRIRDDYFEHERKKAEPTNGQDQ